MLSDGGTKYLAARGGNPTPRQSLRGQQCPTHRRRRPAKSLACCGTRRERLPSPPFAASTALLRRARAPGQHAGRGHDLGSSIQDGRAPRPDSHSCHARRCHTPVLSRGRVYAVSWPTLADLSAPIDGILVAGLRAAHRIVSRLAAVEARVAQRFFRLRRGWLGELGVMGPVTASLRDCPPSNATRSGGAGSASTPACAPRHMRASATHHARCSRAPRPAPRLLTHKVRPGLRSTQRGDAPAAGPAGPGALAAECGPR